MIRLSGSARLKCSFCGRKDAQVARLIAGPRVHICDGCVGVCNKILEASPADFAGWSAMSDAQLLAGLALAEATVEATRGVLQAQIDELRRRKVTWEAIGAALGISRQAAWERFA